MMPGEEIQNPLQPRQQIQEQFYTIGNARERDLSPAVLHYVQSTKEALTVDTKLAESLELQGYY